MKLPPDSLPGLPRNEEGPIFSEPWEAQAFAMTLALHEQGLFTWPQWTAALSDQITRAQRAGDPDLGTTYYRHWLAALEVLLARELPHAATQLEDHRLAWARAATRTPHGSPIELRADDYSATGAHPP